MSDDVLTLLGQRHAVRILAHLRSREGARFTELQNGLGLNPAQVDRALKSLLKGAWVVAQTVPAPRAKRIVVTYALTRRGTGLLKSFDGLRSAAERQRPALGDEVVDDLERLLA